MDSGYPTSDVVKTASPEIFAFAPNDLPWKIGPSLMVNVALPLEIGVPFGLIRGSRVEDVVCTVAKDRA